VESPVQFSLFPAHPAKFCLSVVGAFNEPQRKLKAKTAG